MNNERIYELVITNCLNKIHLNMSVPNAQCVGIIIIDY